jgi:hypothetical protein
MNRRDTLNSQENYHEIIKRQKEFILEELEDLKGYNSDDQDKINDTYETIVKYSLDNLIANYSLGETIESIKKEYLSTLNYYQHSWSQSNGYVSMIWMLSIGIMLEIEQEQFMKLVSCVEKDDPNDFLIDFLISSKISDWEKHNNFKFPRPYENIKQVIDLSKDNKEAAVERLLKYLQKEWYRGHADTGWYDAHKSKWNIHTGYWSFESGAVAKILGLFDEIIKDQQYYPYDMVHWKN